MFSQLLQLFLRGFPISTKAKWLTLFKPGALRSLVQSVSYLAAQLICSTTYIYIYKNIHIYTYTYTCTYTYIYYISILYRYVRYIDDIPHCGFKSEMKYSVQVWDEVLWAKWGTAPETLQKFHESCITQERLECCQILTPTRFVLQVTRLSNISGVQIGYTVFQQCFLEAEQKNKGA